MIVFPHRYDSDKQAVCIFFDFDNPKTLVPNEVLMEWSKHLREGNTPCGKTLKHVHFVFPSKEAAEYNRQAIDFAGLSTCVGTLEAHGHLEGEGASFSAREDFGIDPEK